MGMVPWGQHPSLPERLPQLIAEAPRKPRPPERRRTSHGLHLAITLVLGLFTFWAFFIGALAWLVVWFVIAMVHDNSNHRERRDFNHSMESYPARLIAWQLRCKHELGWVPQIPE